MLYRTQKKAGARSTVLSTTHCRSPVPLNEIQRCTRLTLILISTASLLRSPCIVEDIRSKPFEAEKHHCLNCIWDQKYRNWSHLAQYCCTANGNLAKLRAEHRSYISSLLWDVDKGHKRQNTQNDFICPKTAWQLTKTMWSSCLTLTKLRAKPRGYFPNLISLVPVPSFGKTTQSHRRKKRRYTRWKQFSTTTSLLLCPCIVEDIRSKPSAAEQRPFLNCTWLLTNSTSSRRKRRSCAKQCLSASNPEVDSTHCRIPVPPNEMQRCTELMLFSNTSSLRTTCSKEGIRSKNFSAEQLPFLICNWLHFQNQFKY